MFIEGKTLAKVEEYLKKHDDAGVSDDEKMKFDEEFVSQMAIDDLLDLLSAADYLHIEALLEIVRMKIADIVNKKSVSWLRKTFDIENDFTPEEEEAVRREYPWAWEDVEDDED